MEDPPEMVEQRRSMVAGQIRGRGIRDSRLLDAMQAVPRHLFVPRVYQHLAYSDGPLPIGEGQTISQPYIVALMTDLLDLQADDTVLEIGTGSGYQAAVLACLAKEVHTIERHTSLAEIARQALEEAGIPYDERLVRYGEFDCESGYCQMSSLLDSLDLNHETKESSDE